MSNHTFRIWRDEMVWQVYRDDGFYGDFLTRGDAIRAACFGARSDEQRGHTAQVLADPGNQPIPHFAPHFGD